MVERFTEPRTRPAAPAPAAGGAAISEWDRILADLHDFEDIDRALRACEALDRGADEAWLPGLHRLLAEGRNFFVREAAAAPIARLEGLRALPQLLHALKLGEDEGHDNDGLAALIADLVWSGPEAAAPILRSMIGEPAGRRRQDAAWLWGFAARALVPEPLLPLLGDPDPRVRAAALGSLGSFKGREEVFAGLLAALDDPDEGVRATAAGSLGDHGDPRAIPSLRRLLSDPTETVRPVVEHALRRLEKAR